MHLSFSVTLCGALRVSSTPTHYHIQSDAKSTTIQLEPDIGNAAWGDIEQVGTELLSSVNQKNSSAWLIDLSRLDYMGSALVALLVRIWKAVQSGGGKVVVVCGEGMPRDVINLAGLDKVWTISRTPEDGYRTLGVRAPTTAGAAAAATARPAPADEFPILGVLSIVAALVAGGVLAAIISRMGIEPNLARLGMFGSAGIAVALGMLSFVREKSWGRGLGMFALLAGVAVGAAGYAQQKRDHPAEEPERPASVGQPEASALPNGASAPADSVSDEGETLPDSTTSGEDSSSAESAQSPDPATTTDSPTTDNADRGEPESE
jgi:anti-anti-sigma factor